MSHYNFVIPYRDRPNCLREFVARFPAYLRTQAYITSFNILIVEQEPGKLFNLAKLINVGFDVMRKKLPYSPDDCFVFHPVDLIPLGGSFEIPPHSFTMFVDDPEVWIDKDETLYGKAHGFRNEVMERINGYSNDFWGWGSEDDEMQHRLRFFTIQKFVSVIEYESLMGDAHRDGKNLDTPNADLSRNVQNAALALKAKETAAFTGGLDTLAYTVTSESRVQGAENIYHVVVSI